MSRHEGERSPRPHPHRPGLGLPRPGPARQRAARKRRRLWPSPSWARGGGPGSERERAESRGAAAATAAALSWAWCWRRGGPGGRRVCTVMGRGGGEAAGPVTGGSSALGTDTGRRGPPGRFRSRGPQRGLALPSPRKSPVWSQSRAAGGSRRQKSRPGTRQARPVAGRDGECPRLRATAGLAGRLCGQGTGSPRRLEPAPASRLGLGASLGSGNQVPGVDPTPPPQANSLLSHPGGARLAPRRPRCPRRHVLPTRQGFGK